MVLGDGAKWSWNLAREQFPQAIQIVDLFHAKERLWEVVRALDLGSKDQVKAWAEARCEDLEEGRIDGLLVTLRAHTAASKEADKCVNYIETNRERMRYKEFQKQGLSVGSGVVEAGCKSLVRTRVKRVGMYWTKDGANAIIALRSYILSGRHEDSCEQRATTKS